MIKTLFQTGASVEEFVHVRVEDLLLGCDPPQIHIIHAKRQPIATFQPSRRWPTNCAHTSSDGKKDFISRAIGIPGIPPEWSNL